MSSTLGLSTASPTELWNPSPNLSSKSRMWMTTPPNSQMAPFQPPCLRWQTSVSQRSGPPSSRGGGGSRVVLGEQRSILSVEHSFFCWLISFRLQSPLQIWGFLAWTQAHRKLLVGCGGFIAGFIKAIVSCIKPLKRMLCIVCCRKTDFRSNVKIEPVSHIKPHTWGANIFKCFQMNAEFDKQKPAVFTSFCTCISIWNVNVL